MTAPGDPFAAMFENVATIQRRSAAALNALRDIGPIEVGCSEKTCVHSEGKMRLFRFVPIARSANLRPLLICYAMINRPYMLDLQPDRSLIRELLGAGLDVFMIDWGYPDGADRFTSLDEYVCGYLDRCVGWILEDLAIDSINLLGVCQGGTLSLCYTALEPHKVANLITMVTPVDFKTPENLLSKWAQHIDADLLTQSGNVAGEFLNLVFLSLMPFRLTQQKYVNLLHMQGDRARYETFMRMEKWIFDSPDQPACAFREFVQRFYQQNQLIRGELEFGGRRVRLEHIVQPVLNIYATQDHLVPPSASIPLGAHIGSEDYRTLPVDVGHIGMYVSGSARAAVPGAITQWLTARQPGRGNSPPVARRPSP